MFSPISLTLKIWERRKSIKYLPEKTASYRHHDLKRWVQIHCRLWDFTLWSHTICSPKLRTNHNVPDRNHATSRRQENHDYSPIQEERDKRTSTPTIIIHIIIHCATKLSITPKGFVWNQLPEFHRSQRHQYNS